LAPIVDIEANAVCRIIASVDKSRKCVLSMLHTGKVVRAFAIDGDDILRRVTVFAAGYVAVLAERELPGGWKTVVRVFGMDGRKVAGVEFDGEAAEWGKGEYACALSCLAVAFESRDFVLLRMPGLQVIGNFVSDCAVVAINFCRGGDAFVVSTADGKIWSFAP
jgi:hypothetical protein